MNIHEIQKIITLVEHSNINEIEIKDNNNYLRISMNTTKNNMNHIKNNIIKDHNIKKNIKKNHIIIKSPMIGTFYKSSSPESTPFITEGQKIVPGNIRKHTILYNIFSFLYKKIYNIFHFFL